MHHLNFEIYYVGFLFYTDKTVLRYKYNSRSVKSSNKVVLIIFQYFTLTIIKIILFVLLKIFVFNLRWRILRANPKSPRPA